MPGVRSASIGVWVGVGSRDESPTLSGASHFLEHLLFKGTPSRSALDISVELDEVGGEFNAFTAKEYTCFHARVLDEDLPLAVDVLGDMITSSTITAEDVEAEREVILDEIAMHDDDPDDVVSNVYAEQAWGTSPLGRPIAGTVESIKALTRTQIRRYYRSRYTPANMVVAVAGNVDHATVVRLGEAGVRACGLPRRDRHPPGARALGGPAASYGVRGRGRHPPLRAGQPGPRRQRPGAHRRAPLRARRVERRARRRDVVPAVPGGPGAPRAGLLGLLLRLALRRQPAPSRWPSAAYRPRSPRCWRWSAASSSCWPGDGISPVELQRGQGQLRGGLVLSLEDSGSRMSRIAKAELLYDELPSIDDVLQRVAEVTLEDVNALARELFTQPQTLAVVGPFDTLPG